MARSLDTRRLRENVLRDLTCAVHKDVRHVFSLLDLSIDEAVVITYCIRLYQGRSTSKLSNGVL